MSRRTAKALWIDPMNRTFTEVIVSDLASLQRLVDGSIQIASVLENGDILFTNAEALLRNPRHFFNIDTRPGYPLAGTAVLVGDEENTDDGEFLGHVDVRTTMDELERRIAWRTPAEVAAWAKANASEPIASLTSLTTGKTTVLSTVGEFFGAGPRWVATEPCGE